MSVKILFTFVIFMVLVLLIPIALMAPAAGPELPLIASYIEPYSCCWGGPDAVGHCAYGRLCGCGADVRNGCPDWA